MKTVLALAAIAVSIAALTSCSSESTTSATDTSDHALAEEISTSVYSRELSTVAHPDDFIAATADGARASCSAMDSMSEMGTLPGTPTAISKDAVAKMIQRITSDSDLTDQQARNELWVYAKYRCPQHSAALGAHFDAVPVTKR